MKYTNKTIYDFKRLEEGKEKLIKELKKHNIIIDLETPIEEFPNLITTQLQEKNLTNNDSIIYDSETWYRWTPFTSLGGIPILPSEIILHKNRIYNNIFIGNTTIKTHPLITKHSSIKENESINLSKLFENCISLNSIDVSNLGKINNLHNFARYCLNLKYVKYPDDLSSLISNNSIDYIHYYNYLLQEFPFNNKTINALSSLYAFQHCYSITEVNNFTCPTLIESYGTFSNCQNLKNVDGFNIPNSNQRIISLFENCFNLEKISNSNLGRPSNIEQLFLNCNKLKKIENFTIDMTNVYSMSSTFKQNFSLETQPVFSKNTPNVIAMNSSFEGCIIKDGIVRINAPLLNGTNNMFLNSNIKEIYLNTPKLGNANTMLRGIMNLELVELPQELNNLSDFVNNFRNCGDFSLVNKTITTNSLHSISQSFCENYSNDTEIKLVSNKINNLHSSFNNTFVRKIDLEEVPLLTSLNYSIAYNKNLEEILLNENSIIRDYVYTFRDIPNIKIVKTLNAQNINNLDYLTKDKGLLEVLKIKNLNTNLDLRKTPKINEESINYIIKNSLPQNTTKTIHIESVVYNKISPDNIELAKLNNFTFNIV